MKLKLLFSILAVGVILGLSYVYFSTGLISSDDGEITVELVSQDGQVLKTKTLSFETGENLYEVLDRHFELELMGSRHDSFGRILLGIDELSTDFQSSFIYIELNGEAALRGIDNLPLEDGATYRFSIKEPY